MPPEVTVPTADGGCVEQVAGEADQLVLHGEQAREGGGVQPVGAGVRRDRLAPDPVHLGQAGVVDVGQRAPAVHGQVAGLQLAQPGRDRRRDRWWGVHRSTSWASRE